MFSSYSQFTQLKRPHLGANFEVGASTVVLTSALHPSVEKLVQEEQPGEQAL